MTPLAAIQLANAAATLYMDFAADAAGGEKTDAELEAEWTKLNDEVRDARAFLARAIALRRAREGV